MNVPPFSWERSGERMIGPFRRPKNLWNGEEGSIHDDRTAGAMGFEGGVVAGNVHLEQFTPLMIAAFGSSWRRSGGISLYFETPTLEGQPVRCGVGDVGRSGSGSAAAIWMETSTGSRVCQGNAWAGGDDPNSALRQRIGAIRPPSDLRIIADVHVGDKVEAVSCRAEPDEAFRRAAAVTEPSDDFAFSEEYGAPIATAGLAVDVLRSVESQLLKAHKPYIGMFGAIELQQIDGPVLVGKDYVASAKVVALSDSPKTEMVWYESELRDPGAGRPIARLLLLSRLLKASSPLWSTG